MRFFWLVALIAGLSVPGLAGGGNDDLGPVATLNFIVLKDANGKPVRNASVVMHLVSDKGKQEKGDLELKTDPDGKASYQGVPYGKLRVQVLAPGFQTFGEDYEVNQPTVGITIKLKRPAGQYSIYESQPD
ncbi:MAG TPA: carboxypeptidase-like regulatory domain-containing protein, partial [Terriglobales bacterium]|nr:carboxypeptidase-like regulatory domain-containing protein [Terriglobales bacterium]